LRGGNLLLAGRHRVHVLQGGHRGAVLLIKRFIVYFKNICDSTSIKKSYNYYNCFLIVSATFYNCFLVRDYTSQAEARRR